ncbi:MAG TPA: phospholipase D-like domain-containing protein [Anaerolineales bacterium]|nr:phospholipase D-like domain-containing protein [Anaerolineales bacterium]
MSPRRRTKRSNAMIALFTLVILIILGIYNSLSGGDGADVFPEVTSTGVVPTSMNASGTWWEVYFTDPLNVNNPQNWQGSLEGRLIDKIKAAQTSIHIASFEFDLTPVAEALVAARRRGVDVRWVTDDEHGLEADEEPDRGQFALLTDAGVEVRSDSRSALMHNKFWIFDGQTVWTGSTNITESGVFKQDNNTIVIQSPELAAIYEMEFNEMWNGEFGPRSTSQIEQQTIVVNGSAVQVVFTSEDPAIEQFILPVVRSATQSIRFLTFSFTDFPLAEAMLQRAGNGVDVAGVFEKVGSDTDAAELRTLYCAQIPVRTDGNSGFMHNKVIVVDDRYVITGSLNFSTNAEESNDENVIIIDNPDIAKLYLQDFERVWSLASDPEAGKITCP